MVHMFVARIKNQKDRPIEGDLKMAALRFNSLVDTLDPALGEVRLINIITNMVVAKRMAGGKRSVGNPAYGNVPTTKTGGPIPKANGNGNGEDKKSMMNVVFLLLAVILAPLIIIGVWMATKKKTSASTRQSSYTRPGTTYHRRSLRERLGGM